MKSVTNKPEAVCLARCQDKLSTSEFPLSSPGVAKVGESPWGIAWGLSEEVLPGLHSTGQFVALPLRHSDSFTS